MQNWGFVLVITAAPSGLAEACPSLGSRGQTGEQGPCFRLLASPKTDGITLPAGPAT